MWSWAMAHPWLFSGLTLVSVACGCAALVELARALGALALRAWNEPADPRAAGGNP
jgi:hypothetical protein